MKVKKSMERFRCANCGKIVVRQKAKGIWRKKRYCGDLCAVVGQRQQRRMWAQGGGMLT